MAVVSRRSASFAFIFFLAFAMIIVPTVLATGSAKDDKVNSGIVDFDQFYKDRSDNAMDEAVKSFEPNPEKVTQEFNKQVGAELKGEHAGKKH